MVCQKHLKDLPSLTHVFPGMIYEEMNFFFLFVLFICFKQIWIVRFSKGGETHFAASQASCS